MLNRLADKLIDLLPIWLLRWLGELNETETLLLGMSIGLLIIALISFILHP